MSAAVPGTDRLLERAAARSTRRRRVLAGWAASWAVILALVFVGVTALTLTLWLTDRDYDETTPVVDVAFLVLGAAIAVGFGAQVRGAERRPAGVHQALVGGLCLSVAGVAGARVEPAVGGVVLLGAAGVLLALHPDRWGVVPGAGRSRPLMILALGAVVPVGGYSGTLLELARTAGPSCFGGQCARGDRFAEAAAAAVAVVLLAAVGASRPRGWRLPVLTAGLGAVVIGGVSLAVPAVGAPSGPWAIVAVLWGFAVAGVGEWEARSRPREPVGPAPGGGAGS
jgi:hypothetical protein